MLQRVASYWSGPAQPSLEDDVRHASEKNKATLSQLQQEYDDETQMIDQLGLNVKRLAAQGNNAEAQACFRKMQAKQRNQKLLAGKIDSLSTVSQNVVDMRTNVDIHSAIKQSNIVSSRIGKELTVKNVDSTMAEAANHVSDHKEVSQLLGGENFFGQVVDEDEMASDMASFLGVAPTSKQPTPVIRQDRSKQAEEEAALMKMMETMARPPSGRPLTAQERQAQMNAGK